MAEDENSWDKSKVKDRYERHAGREGTITLPEAPIKDLKAFLTPKKAIIGAFMILAFLTVLTYSGFLSTLLFGPEAAAKNIASQDPVIQEFKTEFDTVEDVSRVPNSTLQKLRDAKSIPEDAKEVYIVDYTNEDGQGVSAYVSLESGNVLDRRRSFSIN